jgi:hypothetical protein
MEQFVHRQNLERFRDLLSRVTDEEQRSQIKHLLAEEEAKEPPPQLAPPILQ